MDDQFHIPTGAVLGSLFAGFVAFVGWIVKVAIAETISGLRKSLDQNSRASESLAEAVDRLSIKISDHEGRISHLEGWKQAQE